MQNLLWIIPIAPLVGALINGVITMTYSGRERRPNEALVALIAVLGP